ncbi:MAG: putative Ig domain-containing protein [Luteolibacter sp.]
MNTSKTRLRNSNYAEASASICKSVLSQRVCNIGILLVTSAQIANALPVYEPFSYPVGTQIAQKNLGTGWAAPWTSLIGNGSIDANAGSLSYPAASVSGNKMFFEGTPGSGINTYLFRQLSAPLIEGHTYYISFLAQNLNEGRQFFGLSLYTDSGEELLIGQSSYSPNWTVNRLSGLDSTVGVLVSNVDSSKPAMLLVKLDMRSGAEKVTFWVNPILSKAENGSAPQGGTSFLTKEDLGSVLGVRVGGGGYRNGINPTNHFMDEIRIDEKSPFADTRDFDGDGLNNYEEIHVYKTNPNKADTDGDTLTDGNEVLKLKTNPLVFTKWITSDLSILKLKLGKDMLRYKLTTNIGANRFTATGLPSGLKMNIETGVISGKPTKKGTFKVALTAKNKSNVTVHGVILIKVS